MDRNPSLSEIPAFDDRTLTRTFFNAPQSVTSFVAAFLEPAISVFALLLATMVWSELLSRPILTLSLIVFALTFPGRDRFGEHPIAAAVGVLSNWVALVAVLLLCGHASRSLQFFETKVLVVWVLSVPILQWIGVWTGAQVIRRLAARPSARRPAVIVGAGPAGVRVAKAIAESHDRGLIVAGYFDDRGDARVQPEATLQRLGDLKDVAAYANEQGVREIYITLPLGSQPRIVELLEQLQGTTASLYFVPDVFGISIIQGRLQDLCGVPVVGICETPFTGTNDLAKRVSDIVLSLIILVVLSPLLLALAVGVKLSSPGPVIFRQRRNGLDGGEIIVYKFRSMRVQENGAQVRQAVKGDARITPFGAFIRRTSLDELPQFINVLQGRMSIVGPRPHAVAHNEEYRRLIKAYMVRHKVRPGITGWAQVHGYRGETETIQKMHTRIEYDLEYLRNWSLTLDLQIIAQTLRVIFFDRHAY